MSNGSVNGTGSTPTAAPSPQKPSVPNDMVIPLTLTVIQINQLLTIIGKEPLGQVMDLFMAIRSQGDMALMTYRTNAAEKKEEVA